MTKFKIGDKIKIHVPGHSMNNKIGTIIRINPPSSTYPFSVRELIKKHTDSFKKHELTLIKKSKFKVFNI